jgi:hypothetical protein
MQKSNIKSVKIIGHFREIKICESVAMVLILITQIRKCLSRLFIFEMTDNQYESHNKKSFVKTFVSPLNVFFIFTFLGYYPTTYSFS